MAEDWAWVMPWATGQGEAWALEVEWVVAWEQVGAGAWAAAWGAEAIAKRQGDRLMSVRLSGFE